MNWDHAIVGLSIDISLWIIPVWIVWANIIWSRRTIYVLAVFSVGIFAIITGVVRIILMIRVDFTIDM